MEANLTTIVGEMIPASIFIVFYLIMKEYYLYHTRKQLIELGKVDADVKNLFQRSTGAEPLSNVKWGIISLFTGIGLLISYLLVQGLPSGDATLISLGIVAILTGIALLIFYRITLQHRRNS